jgi:HPr kinase/phosphorylase
LVRNRRLFIDRSEGALTTKALVPSPFRQRPGQRLRRRKRLTARGSTRVHQGSSLLGDPLLGLAVVAGERGLDRPILTSELNRPCLELTGYFDAFRTERIQVIGKGEVTYIEVHARERGLRENIDRILDADVPCAIVTNGCIPHRLLTDRAEEVGIPMLTCPHSTTKLYKRLWEHLDGEFAPETTLHGVLMDIHDIGVLLLGQSAVGKSECALELIRRGFHLVADDVVTIKCLGDSVLLGRATDLLPYHMEARGIGIIDIRLLFGVAAVRPDKRIMLAITLVDWDPAAEYDRTGLTETSLSILDVTIPHVTIPVRPGRNVGTLVEVAALNHKLKSLGIHTAQLMQERIVERMVGQTGREAEEARQTSGQADGGRGAASAGPSSRAGGGFPVPGDPASTRR